MKLFFKSDKYPKTVIDAFNMMNSWKHLISVLGSVSDGVSFATDGQGGRGRMDRSKLKCYGCGRLGHFEYECPEAKKDEDEPTSTANMLLIGVMDDTDGIKPDNVLIGVDDIEPDNVLAGVD